MRNEPLVEQLQQLGAQSAKVVQADPVDAFPVNRSGVLGQPPLVCSVCEETVVDPRVGSFGSVL